MNTLFESNLEELSTLEGQEAFERFVFAHPSLLLCEEEWSTFEHLVASWGHRATRGDDCLRRLWEFTRDLADGSRPYIFGLGPIERLYERHRTGEISLETAFSALQKPEVHAELSPLYIMATTRAAKAMRLQNEPHKAIVLLRLLLEAATVGLKGDDRMATLLAIADAWVESVTTALEAVPSGELLADTRSRMEELVAELSDSKERAHALYLLGMLVIRPYTTGTSQSLRQDLAQLPFRRYVAEDGPLVNGRQSPFLPNAKDLLQRGIEYLEQARGELSRDCQPAALICWAQAQMALSCLGVEIDQQALRSRIEDACAQFERSLDPNVASLQSICEFLHDDPPSSEAQRSAAEQAARLSEASDSDLISTIGVLNAAETLAVAAEKLGASDPGCALALWRRADALIANYANEGPAEQFLWRSRTRLAPILAAGWYPLPPNTKLSELVAEVARQAVDKAWSGEQVGAMLLGIAMQAPELHSMEGALAIVELTRVLAPAFSNTMDRLLTFLEAGFILDEGMVERRKGNLVVWSLCCLRGARGFAKLGIQSQSFRLVTALIVALQEHFATHSVDDKWVTFLVRWLRNHGVPLAQAGGAALARRTCELAAICCDGLAARGRVAPDLHIELLQIRKALWLASAYASGSGFDIAADSEAGRMLADIQRASAVAEAAAPALEGRVSEALLTTYSSSAREQLPGSTPAEMLVNLQNRFDQRVVTSVWRGVQSPHEVIIDPWQIQRSMDEKTVLVDYTFGSSATGELIVVVTILTRDDVQVGIRPVPGIPGGLQEFVTRHRNSSLVVCATPFREFVSEVRCAVLEDYGDAAVSRRGADALVRATSQLIGQELGVLLEAEKRRGRDHLCIVPDGPLHFLPFHLLGCERCLADDWTITYLPCLRMICRSFADETLLSKRSRPIAAFGIDFAWSPKRKIADAVDEARAIAALFDTSPILNEAATPHAVTLALRESRRVHIASHGEMNVTAPAFHAVDLSNANRPGRLTAHEVLALDLRGLELVSLAACETALGRIDTLGNLRGLPASFLIRGVGAVVGTLWSVQSECAETFFTALYTAIRAEAPIREAFKQAQITARNQYPAYQDWGAFQLVGGVTAYSRSTGAPGPA